MATPYSEIHNVFLNKITDYELELETAELLQEV